MKKPLQSAIRFLLTTLVAVIAVTLGVMLWKHYLYSPWTRDGRVRAEIVKVAPDVSGLVERVCVKDNQSVKKGDLLMVIDQRRYRIAVAQAEAQVESAKARTISAEAQINSVEAQGKSTEAQIAAAEAEYENAKSMSERRKSVADNVVSPEEKEHIASTLAQSGARLADARARLADARSRLADTRSRLTDARASLASAQAALDLAKLNLERTEVRSAVNGSVSNLNVYEGDYANAGAPKMAVVDRDSFWIYGYFEETKIPALKVGDEAEIELMSGGPALRGHIESIAPGITDRDNPAGGELLSNVNPTFSWVRLAQRVPVRIHIDEAPADTRIAAGMTCSIVVKPHGKTAGRAEGGKQ